MSPLDAHLHVWDLEVGRYPWLGPEHGDLYRSHLPAEAERELGDAGVAGAVLVQAEDTATDTAWLLETAASHPWVLGVVGWVQLDDPDVAAVQLDELAGSHLCGIRHLVHDDHRPDFLDLPGVRRSLARVARLGLPLDVPDAWPRHLDAVARLADALPELTVVLDHLAKPPRGGDDLAAWEQALRGAGERPNVVAKLSGLHVPGQPFTVDALRPVRDVALDVFGARRLMFGSDWPMAAQHTAYAEVLEVARALVGELGAAEQEEIWAGTARRVYDLSEGSTDGRKRDV
ncbi:metal-dependent hydrolase [Nocardioides sp. OK12]|uniref:amidohydrolase family protein n=1 Tax=Nocardioides sp. OK12 TaxID=2758661 RepID=UPI0021C40DDB|nr:amidohydrolase family protein [Nocardioides sp. OK12]GHJ59738.1 metal-dependent hydrolase [Nocardioides sp. OK12]